MYIGFRAKNSSVTLLKPHQMITPAFGFIGEDLSNALRPDGILAGVFVGEDVSGNNQLDADTLSFYSGGYFPSEGEIASNVINVEYALETDTVREQVVLKRFTTKNLLASGTIEPDQEVVCRGLAGFDVKYYDGTTWLDAWDSTENDNQLPRGVQVTLTILEEPSAPASRLDNDEPYERSFTRTFILSAARSGYAGRQ